MASRRNLKLSDQEAKNANIIKVGPKQRLLPIPNTHHRVVRGRVKEGDMFANISNPNKPSWQTVESDDIGLDATDFEAIIRKSVYGTCSE